MIFAPALFPALYPALYPLRYSEDSARFVRRLPFWEALYRWSRVTTHLFGIQPGKIACALQAHPPETSLSGVIKTWARAPSNNGRTDDTETATLRILVQVDPSANGEPLLIGRHSLFTRAGSPSTDTENQRTSARCQPAQAHTGRPVRGRLFDATVGARVEMLNVQSVDWALNWPPILNAHLTGVRSKARERERRSPFGEAVQDPALCGRCHRRMAVALLIKSGGVRRADLNEPSALPFAVEGEFDDGLTGPNRFVGGAKACCVHAVNIQRRSTLVKSYLVVR